MLNRLMKSMFAGTILLIQLCLVQVGQTARGTVIENFDDGTVQLASYPGEDLMPDAWALVSYPTYGNSPFSLKLNGNTWKTEAVVPALLDSGTVWQVAAYIQSLGEIQGFGIADSMNVLFYAFAGSEQLIPSDWETVYQGAFPQNTWNIYLLPVADDWLARFGYLPEISELVFVNDRDYDPTAVIYFDEIYDVSADLPVAPQVTISYTIGTIYRNSRAQRSVDVQFSSQVIDPDSPSHVYYWYFGDDSSSNAQNPQHTYLVEDDHDYSVLLEVVDETGLWGRATCTIAVDPGPSSFPLSINFVGDIMLARKYEQPGGIIPTQGVEAIFQPTLPVLGGAADITVANLECPLTNQGTPHPTKSVVFRGSPANVTGLVYAGIDVVTLANNHTIDYGLPGLQQTQSVLAQNGIRFSGAGKDAARAYQPVFIQKSGVNIGFAASSDRTGQYNNYQPFLNAGFNKPGFANLTLFDLARQINQLKPLADLVVAEFHSGSEYSFSPQNPGSAATREEDEFYSPRLFVPSDGDRTLRRQAIDLGADLVICHHPHILQGFEVYNGKVIAHSLGNFVFELDYPETFPTAVLNARFNHLEFSDFTVIPVYIDDYIPRRARGEMGLYLLYYLARRSRELNTYFSVNRDSVTGRIITDTLSMNPVQYPEERAVHLTGQSGYWISAPQPLRRRGSISDISNILPTGSYQFRLGREVVWFGNFEDEGCTLWLLDHPDEYYDSTVFFAGSRSLCQRRDAGHLTLNTNFEKRLMLPSDTAQFTLHTYLKTENSSNTGILVRFYSSRTQPNYIGSSDLGTQVSGSNDWQFYWNDFQPPPGSAFFDLRLRSESPTTGTGYSWWDNTGVIEWTNWQNAGTGVGLEYPNDFYWIQIRTANQQNQATLLYIETALQPAAVGLKVHKPIISGTPELYQNFPNPFNPATTIRYSLLRAGPVRLDIYNLLGQKIRTLVEAHQPAGKQEVIWDGRSDAGKPASSGVYIYRLKTANREISKKMILIR